MLMPAMFSQTGMAQAIEYWYSRTAQTTVFVRNLFDIMFVPQGAIYPQNSRPEPVLEYFEHKRYQALKNTNTHQITYNISKCSWHSFPPFNPWLGAMCALLSHILVCAVSAYSDSWQYTTGTAGGVRITPISWAKVSVYICTAEVPLLGTSIVQSES